MRQDAFSEYHPLTNFLYFLLAICFCAVIQHPIYLLAGVAGGAVYCLLLKGRSGWKLIVGLLPVFLILSALNPLLNNYGKTVLFTVFGRPYTWEALLYGMVISGMLVAMLLWFSCYSAVLTSDKFVCLFGKLIPALSLLLVMVLRMIPNLARKGRQISDARESIGMGAGTAEGLKAKGVAGTRILSALTDCALEGSIVTADSMRARGYGSGKRTSFQIYRISGRDILMIALMLLLALCALWMGGTTAEFTPELRIDRLTWGFGAYCVFLMLPPILHLAQSFRQRVCLNRMEKGRGL